MGEWDQSLDFIDTVTDVHSRNTQDGQEHIRMLSRDITLAVSDDQTEEYSKRQYFCAILAKKWLAEATKRAWHTDKTLQAQGWNPAQKAHDQLIIDVVMTLGFTRSKSGKVVNGILDFLKNFGKMPDEHKEEENIGTWEKMRQLFGGGPK